jgi:hypothetical protein
MSSEQPQSAFLILRERPSAPIEASWRRCLAGCEFVTHYLTPEFFDEPMSDGARNFAVLCLQAGEVVGVATGTAHKSRMLCGNAGRPQFVYSANADAASVMDGLASGLKEFASASGSNLVDLFTWRKLPNLKMRGFLERACKGVVMLDLSLGADALFRGFSSNKKTNIKKAIKSGVAAEMTTDPSDITAYHAIRLDWSRRKGLEPERADLLGARLALTESRRLFVARHSGKIVAGVVVRFAPGQVLEYSANASLEDSLHLRPNDFLHWRIIEWACTEGMKVYSLAGSHLFLRKFGGITQPTYRYRLDRTLLRRYLVEELASKAKERIKRVVPERALDFVRGLRGVPRS